MDGCYLFSLSIYVQWVLFCINTSWQRPPHSTAHKSARSDRDLLTVRHISPIGRINEGSWFQPDQTPFYTLIGLRSAWLGAKNTKNTNPVEKNKKGHSRAWVAKKFYLLCFLGYLVSRITNQSKIFSVPIFLQIKVQAQVVEIPSLAHPHSTENSLGFTWQVNEPSPGLTHALWGKLGSHFKVLAGHLVQQYL